MISIYILRSRFKRTLQGSFFKAFITLLSGATLAQIIPTIVSPALSRLYAPLDFGVLATFNSIVSVLVVVSTMQFDSAIILPRKNGEARLLFGLTLMLPIIVGTIVLLIIGFGNSRLAALLNLEDAGWLFYLIPIVVVVGGWYNTMASWFLRAKEFRILSYRQVGMSLSSALSKVLFGLLNATQIGLILGGFIGQIASLTVFSYSLYRKESVISWIPSLSISRKLVFKYVNFARYTTWQVFFDTISVAIVLWLFNQYLVIELVGLYAFTLAIVQKPISLISGQIGNVYYVKLTERLNNGLKVRLYSRKLFLSLILGSFFLFLPVLIFGESLFGFVFGQEWSMAGLVFLSLSPMLFFRFAFVPFTVIPQVFSKHRAYFIVGIFYNSINPFFYLLFFRFSKIDFLSILMLNSIINVTVNLMIAAWFDGVLGKADKNCS